MAKINAINKPHLKRFIEKLQLKGYSTNTVKTYQNELSQFLFLLKNRDAFICDENTVRNYFL